MLVVSIAVFYFTLKCPGQLCLSYFNVCKSLAKLIFAIFIIKQWLERWLLLAYIFNFPNFSCVTRQFNSLQFTLELLFFFSFSFNLHRHKRNFAVYWALSLTHNLLRKTYSLENTPFVHRATLPFRNCVSIFLGTHKTLVGIFYFRAAIFEPLCRSSSGQL
jgi:hypothetical protein